MPKKSVKKQVESQMVLAETFTTEPLQVVPEMTLRDRMTIMRRQGFPKADHVALATQDLAAGLLRQMSLLVEQSGNPELIAQANKWVEHWNKECESVFLAIVIPPDDTSPS